MECLSILYIKATMVSVCVGSAWKILPVTARSLWSLYCKRRRKPPLNPSHHSTKRASHPSHRPSIFCLLLALPMSPHGISSIPPSFSPSHHPSTESLTLQLSARVGVVGGWRGGFFFQAVFGVESGQSMSTWIVDFPCKFYLGVGGRIYFPFS